MHRARIKLSAATRACVERRRQARRAISPIARRSRARAGSAMRSAAPTGPQDAGLRWLDEILTVAAGSRARPPSSRSSTSRAVRSRTTGTQPGRHDRSGRATAVEAPAPAPCACARMPGTPMPSRHPAAGPRHRRRRQRSDEETCSRPSATGALLVPALDPPYPACHAASEWGCTAEQSRERGILEELEISADTIGRIRRPRHPRRAGGGLRALLEPPRTLRGQPTAVRGCARFDADGVGRRHHPARRRYRGPPGRAGLVSHARLRRRPPATAASSPIPSASSTRRRRLLRCRDTRAPLQQYLKPRGFLEIQGHSINPARPGQTCTGSHVVHPGPRQQAGL